MTTALFKKGGTFRFRYLAGLAVLFLLINLAVRLALQAGFPGALPFSFAMLPGLAKGVLNDCAALTFVILLPATLLLLPTDRFLQRPSGTVFCLAILFLYSLVLVFTGAAEYFFWDEFRSRFNFIAVDYLIYTTEVFQNIVESYPLIPLLAGVFFTAAGITALAWTLLRRTGARAAHASQPAWESSWRARLSALGGLYAAAALVFALFTPFAGSQNRFWNEYAKNGVYELFSAYRHNQLDYRAFYRTMDTRRAFSLLRNKMREADSRFAPAGDDTLIHMAASGTPEKHPNVILVIMESMGSNWLGEYTPNLKELAGQGLSFTNMMSTGTRTVRGIEAVMLSVPPTPGNSIVRRPDNGQLFNLGTMFGAKGYEREFLYGGMGFFDNMNAFFSGNGYRVVDKLDFAPQHKTFATAWGQCDEDLYAESLSQADASYAAGRPFQQVLLTTTNHRPFTYPDGRVSIPSGASRRGAVAYSDYAIGKFMREAREKPWFDNTVFVFVGDHPSAIAGKAEVPADGYGIVCLMYGPRFFQPEKVDTLCSQIDVGPTLLAALGWEYRSQFFGEDARALPRDEGRAWISTYQLLGFRNNDRLVVLRPDGTAEVSRIASAGSAGDPAHADERLAAEAVASYQCAYDLFTEKKLKEQAVAVYTPHRRQAKDVSAAREGRPHGPQQRDARAEADFLPYMLFLAGHMSQ